MQRTLRDTGRVDGGEALRLRIGINLGDLIVDGDDIFGDGRNVAARLESLAEPGGICVSAALRDPIHEARDADYVDGGELRVKNIARPVRVCHVVARDGAAAPASAPRRALPAWFGRRLVASIAAVAFAVGAAAFGQLGEQAKAAEATARLPEALPGFTIGKFKARFPRKAPAQVEAIAERLREAGVPG